jgi:hypothetical protein
MPLTKLEQRLLAAIRANEECSVSLTKVVKKENRLEILVFDPFSSLPDAPGYKFTDYKLVATINKYSITLNTEAIHQRDSITNRRLSCLLRELTDLSEDLCDRGALSILKLRVRDTYPAINYNISTKFVTIERSKEKAKAVAVTEPKAKQTPVLSWSAAFKA